AKREQPAELAALAELLSEALDTRVRIEIGRRSGKLVVEFATMDDLERVLGQLAPGALQSAEPEPAPSPEQQHEHGGEDESQHRDEEPH
ncbi:MAG: hypothetical protein JO074_00840, partial [Frankiales bacterium]|nr:hypothetical protein [Frankiales bacterium]